MKSFGKILSVVLLLALAVSAFAVFPAFAEQSATGAANTVFNLDSYYDKNVGDKGYVYSTSSSHAKYQVTQNGKVYPNLQRKEGVDGNDYYTYGFDGWDANEAYLSTYSDSGCYLNITPSEAVVFKDFTYNGKTNYTKNADYMVIDFDYNVEGSALAQLLYNIRWRSEAKESVMESVFVNGIPEGDSFSVEGRNKTFNANTQSEGWTHITMIVDGSFSNGDVIRTYYYIDGVFVGAGLTSNVYLAMTSIRLQAAIDGVKDADGKPISKDQAAALDNVTIKSFPAGWDGALAEDGNLGSMSVTLDAIPELAYCFEDKPADFKLATVKRGDQVTDVYDVSKLDGNLIDGDEVTLYKQINKTILVPEGANITWNYNGYSAVNTLSVDFGANDWVIRKIDGSLYADGSFGAQGYDESGALVTDNLASAIVANTPGTSNKYNLYVTFLKDATVLSSALSVKWKLVYDLNDHTVTFNKANTLSGDDYLCFRNGTLNCSASTLLVNCSSGSNPFVVAFEDMTAINANYASQNDFLLAMRCGGLILVDNCDDFNLNNGSLAFIGSREGSPVSVIVKDSNIDLTGASTLLQAYNAPSANNVAHADTIFAGGMDLNVCIVRSDVSATNCRNNLINFFNYYNTFATAYANVNTVDIDIVDSKINGGSRGGIIGSTLEVPKNGEEAEPMVIDISVDISGSEIKSSAIDSALVSVKNSTGDAFEADALTYTVGVNVEASTIKLGNGAALTSRKNIAEVSYYFAEGVRLSTCAPVLDGQSAEGVEIVLAEGAEIAYSSDATYTYIVTSSYTPYTYQLGNLEPVTFFWNDPAVGEDEVDISKVVTLDSGVAGAYKYSWVRSGNAFTTKIDKDFSVASKTNLTLYDYIYYNLYIKKADLDKSSDYITVKSGDTTLESVGEIVIDGVSYYKYQVRDITPAQTLDAVISVTFAVEGVYGDAYERTIDLSVLDYTESILAKSTEDNDSTRLIKALLNYIAGACAISGNTETENAALALIEGETFASVATEGARFDSLEGVELSIKYGDAFYLGLKSEAGDVFTVSYVNSDGETVVKTAVANDRGIAFAVIKACDFAGDVTIKKGNESAVMNIAGYYLAVNASETLTPEEKAEAQTMIEAIYNYSVAAAAYKASIAE